MSGKANVDRRSRRRQETADEIVAAAWDQVREHGLAGLAMRDLGARVGMRAQSLYSYFASKREIYDAMFAQGNQEFLEWITDDSDADGSTEARLDAIRRASHRFFEFCVDDPVRHQLLFQRTIPDFVPSEQSYAIAQAAYERSTDRLKALGLDQSSIDLWTALLLGLVAQQLANDPGGDRWAVLVERAVDMFVAATGLTDKKTKTPRSK